jgi:hypothetical protein
MEVQVRYDVSTLNGVALFCDLIVRFAAELTPEVGPPFLTCLIFPDNSIQEIRNDTFSPLSNKLKEYHLEIPLNKYTPAKAEHEATALVLPSGIDMSQKRHTPPYSGGTITP